MRGKPIDAAGDLIAGRITPAHAGKTVSSSATCRQGRDHPRACGENVMGYHYTDGVDRITPAHAGKTVSCNISYGAACGSPPRMRGKRINTRRSTAHCRITPAHAGKTGAGGGSASIDTDHPRACGEN